MPELPEVECARTLLGKHLVGKTIVRVNLMEQGGGPRTGLFDDVICCESVPMSDIERALIGKVKNVHRRGKQLWFEMCGSAVAVLFHFGMTGSFLIKGLAIPQYKTFAISPIWPPKFTKIEMITDDDLHIAFCDPRRLGRVKLRSDPLNMDPISCLAPDPFLDGVSPTYVHTELLKYSAPIKAVLLDQEKVFCGIGNYIVDEVLYQSKIHPNTPSKNIAMHPTYVQALSSSLDHVVKTAVSSNIASEDFPKDWLFHYRWEKRAGKSIMPNGNKISFCTVGSRTTAVVDKEQKLLTLPRGMSMSSTSKPDVEVDVEVDNTSRSSSSLNNDTVTSPLVTKSGARTKAKAKKLSPVAKKTLSTEMKPGPESECVVEVEERNIAELVHEPVMTYVTTMEVVGDGQLTTKRRSSKRKVVDLDAEAPISGADDVIAAVFAAASEGRGKRTKRSAK